MSEEEILNRVENWVSVIGAKLEVPAQQLMEAAIRYYTAEALGVIILSLVFILLSGSIFSYGFFTWDRKEHYPSQKSGICLMAGGIMLLFSLVIGGAETTKALPKLLAPEWAIVKNIMKD